MSSPPVVGCVPGDVNAQQCEGAGLARAELHGAFLSGFDLRRADLREANLTDADLTGADLSGADLTNAVLTGAQMMDSIFRDTTLAGADRSQGFLRDADITGADLTGARLSGADLGGADFSGGNLTGADLTGAIAPDTHWEDVTLQETLDGVQQAGATGLTDSALAANLGVDEGSLGGALSAQAIVLGGDLAQVWTDACAGRPSADAAPGWSNPPQVVFPEPDLVKASLGTYDSMDGFDAEVFLVIGHLPVRLVDVATGAELSTFSITSDLHEGCPQYVLQAQVGGVGYGADQRNPVFDILDQIDALPRPG